MRQNDPTSDSGEGAILSRATPIVPVFVFLFVAREKMQDAERVSTN
jgi:hypothetical protein